MLSQPDTFMSLNRQESPLMQQLIQRLYRTDHKEYGKLKNGNSIGLSIPIIDKTAIEKSSITITALPPLPTLDEIKEIVRPTLLHPPAPVEGCSTQIAPEHTLIESIQTFQKQKEKGFANYRILFKERPLPLDNALFVLHGWRPEFYLDPLFSLSARARATSGGLFIRWNGKGIVINPGRYFLENFHKQGLHVWDIHAVIVTRKHQEVYADIQEIYALNYKLNKNSSETHVINYYLAQKAFQVLSPLLKPHFKQEKHSLHCLELFLDSPDIEKIEIDPGIIMQYFPLGTENVTQQTANQTSKQNKTPLTHNSLGIKLELKPAGKGNQGCNLGYVSGGPWNSSISQNLGACDLLITGFGNTTATDYRKQKYSDTCLGYFGTHSLLSEVNPKLMLCSEFSGAEGDIRLEVVKLLRQQWSQKSHVQIPAIQPGDLGMLINLKRLHVQCSITKNWIDPNLIRAVRTRDSFGSLQYLSPSCWS